jgi:serine/threonine protein kinase
MTLSGGRVGHWGHLSGVRNSLPGLTDRTVVLPNMGEKFEITGRHAEGATCDVFKAHHVGLDLAVAIKVLKRQHAFDPRFAERMRIEAQVLPRLKSRHIVQCFDRGVTSDGRPYTVLEFLRGETLDAILERAGRLDERAVIDIGTALLDALETTHSRGIVHRDVSLRNLIVHRTEHEPATPKLIDFGFALVLPTAPESAPEPAEFPERDAVVGTPRFTSPEVARGVTDIDPRADLYSAGAVLYALLAGRDPFAHLDTPAAVLQAHAHHPVPPLSQHTPHLSPALQSVVARLLEKDRTRRFATALDARLALVQAGKVAHRSTMPAHGVPRTGRAHLNGSSNQPRPREAVNRTPASLEESLAPTIHLLDQNHCVATWLNVLVHVCRGTLTIETIERMSDVAREALPTRTPIVVVSIIETTAPTPRDSVRPRYAAFFRELAPFTAANLVLVDGGQFRASTVQSVGAALTHSARERIPFEFVRTIEEAAGRIGPHLPAERRDEDTLPTVRRVLERVRAQAESGPSEPSKSNVVRSSLAAAQSNGKT